MAPALQTPVRQESKEDIERESDRKLSREQTERMVALLDLDGSGKLSRCS